MQKIWNDPVWSKVIAGVILFALSAIGTAAYTLYTTPDGQENWLSVLVENNMTVNSYVLTTTLVLLITIMIIYLVVSRKEYDIFFSAPMSVDTDEEYQELRDKCLQLIGELKKNKQYKSIYYAAENKESMNDFTPGNHAVTDDLQALRKSKRLFLYMPKKIPTSAIFEAGYAFKKNLPTVYFCHNDNDLPFLMRDLNGCFRAVNKYTAQNFDQLLNYIKEYGKGLFKKST